MTEALTLHNMIGSVVEIFAFSSIALAMNKRDIKCNTAILAVIISFINMMGYASQSILARQSLLVLSISVFVIVSFRVEGIPNENIPKTIFVVSILSYIMQIGTMMILDAAGENIFLVKPYNIYPAFQILSITTFAAYYYVVFKRGGLK